MATPTKKRKRPTNPNLSSLTQALADEAAGQPHSTAGTADTSTQPRNAGQTAEPTGTDTHSTAGTGNTQDSTAAATAGNTTETHSTHNSGQARNAEPTGNVPAESPITADTNASVSARSASPSEPAEELKRKGGRPRKDTERLVVYLEPAVYDAVRRFGFENRRTYSNVMNALAEQFLSQLDPETVKKK